MFTKRVTAASLCVLGLSIAGLAIAQQTQPSSGPTDQKGGEPAPEKVGHHAHWRNTNHKLATCMAIGNHAEVAIAKFAATKSQNGEVRSFANMLVKEHQEMLAKLKKFAPEAAREGYLTEIENNASSENRHFLPALQKDIQALKTSDPAAVKNTKPRSEAADLNSIEQVGAVEEAADSPPIDFAQLHKEIAEECIQSAKAMMNKKNGNELDKCFIGMQIASHAMMKNQLVVFERHVSGDLKQVITEGIETAERHMHRAEAIMNDLKKLDGLGPSPAKTSSLK